MAGTKRRKAFDPEARENQLIALAQDRAEELMLSDHPPVQIIGHYLKQGARKNQKELEKLQEEVELLRAKTQTLQAQRHSDELYQRVIDAMRMYSGNADEDSYYNGDY